MKICIDEELCIACGFCTGSVPDVFDMTGDKAAVIGDVTDQNRDAVIEAMEGCPTGAIKNK